MTSDFTGFNFLPASMQPALEAQRGSAMGVTAAPDATPMGTASVAGWANSFDDLTQHVVANTNPGFRKDF